MKGYLMTLEGYNTEPELGWNPVSSIKKGVKKIGKSVKSVAKKVVKNPIPSIPTPSQLINNPLTRAVLPDKAVKSVANAVNRVPGVSAVNATIAKTNALKNVVNGKIIDSAELIKAQALKNPEITGAIIGAVTMNPAAGAAATAALKTASSAEAVYKTVSSVIPDSAKNVVRDIIQNPANAENIVVKYGAEKAIPVLDSITEKAVQIAQNSPEIKTALAVIDKNEKLIADKKDEIKSVVAPIVKSAAPEDSDRIMKYIIGAGIAGLALFTLSGKK